MKPTEDTMGPDGLATHQSHAVDTPSTVATALRHPAAHVLLWGTTLGALAADLYSKHWAFTSLGSNEVREVIPGVLAFRRSLNSGALFGMGAGRGPVFIVASLVALGFVIYLFCRSGARQRSLHLALGLILAGAMGNLHDRVFVVADVLTLNVAPGHSIGRIVPTPNSSTADPDAVYLGSYPDGANPRRYFNSAITRQGRVGVVRDFIRFEPSILGRKVWPWVFNIADSCLVIGVGILLLDCWRERRRLNRVPQRG